MGDGEAKEIFSAVKLFCMTDSIQFSKTIKLYNTKTES